MGVRLDSRCSVVVGEIVFEVVPRWRVDRLRFSVLGSGNIWRLGASYIPTDREIESSFSDCLVSRECLFVQTILCRVDVWGSVPTAAVELKYGSTGLPSTGAPTIQRSPPCPHWA